jgi:hypothetical protein
MASVSDILLINVRFVVVLNINESAPAYANAIDEYVAGCASVYHIDTLLRPSQAPTRKPCRFDIAISQPRNLDRMDFLGSPPKSRHASFQIVIPVDLHLIAKRELSNELRTRRWLGAGRHWQVGTPDR